MERGSALVRLQPREGRVFSSSGVRRVNLEFEREFHSGESRSRRLRFAVRSFARACASGAVSLCGSL